MQPDDFALLETLVETVEKAVSDINNRIDALEKETDVHVLDGIDPERTDYRRNQLARHKNGLHQFDGTKWKCIVDSIDPVEVENGDGTAKLVFAKSSGDRIEREITYARPSRRKVAA